MATKPAVSVRSLLSPKVIGVNLCCIAFSISDFEKSPSGPIKIMAFYLGCSVGFSGFLSVFSQCAMNKLLSESFFIKSEKLIKGFNIGR